MWNYRLFKYEEDEEELIYISECYYDKDFNITGYVEPTQIFNRGFCTDDKEEWRSTLLYMMMAIKKPIIILREDGGFYEE